MTFNPKESIDFNGNTGPFIQYTYARIQSVLRKAKEAGITVPAQLPLGIELSEKEEGLIQMIADFATVVKQAGEDYSPSLIANYTYDLVKEYNQFYHDFSILREENEAVKIFRLEKPSLRFGKEGFYFDYGFIFSSWRIFRVWLSVHPDHFAV